MPIYKLDHGKYAKEYIDAAIDIYTSQECINHLKLESHRAKPIKDKEQFQVGPWRIMPFDVMHDIKTFGFIIYHVPTKNKIIFFTDTYYVPVKFKDVNNIIGEINFSYEIIDRKTKEGARHVFLRDRILQSHMSLHVFQDFLRANDLTAVNNIVLQRYLF